MHPESEVGRELYQRSAGARVRLPPADWRLRYWIKTLLPGPPSRTSWPGPPIRTSSPGAAEEGVVAGAADQHVVAVAAVLRQLDRGGGQPRSVHHVVAGQRVDDQAVVGRLGAGDVHPGSQTQDVRVAGVAGDRNGVVAGGAVDDDGVGLAVADAAAGRAREVEVHVGDAGAGQVVDGDGVGAAEGDDVDLLDAVDVHGHVAHVAEQPQPAAVGRQVDVLADVGAVELQACRGRPGPRPRRCRRRGSTRTCRRPRP